jgi:hypothetical protein
VGGRGRGWGIREEVGKGGEMTQTLYAHMNLKKKKRRVDFTARGSDMMCTPQPISAITYRIIRKLFIGKSPLNFFLLI